MSFVSFDPKATVAISEYLQKNAAGSTIQKAVEQPVHEQAIGKILYTHMPKMVRMAFKEEKFLHFFSQNKSMLLAQIGKLPDPKKKK